MKTSLFLFFTAMFIFQSLASGAQDSSAVVKIAKMDAEKFEYNKADKKAARQNIYNPGSDYFKPTIAYASQKSLLEDSTYVWAFKRYASEKMKARKKESRTIITVGIIVAVVVVAILIANSSFHALGNP